MPRIKLEDKMHPLPAEEVELFPEWAVARLAARDNDDVEYRAFPSGRVIEVRSKSRDALITG